MGFQVSRSTSAQRAEVVRLREKGWSIRAIAAEVFGDQRFRGRVERNLASSSRGFGEVAEDASLDGLAPRQAIRILYERRLAKLVSGEVAPSMTELVKLLEVQQCLQIVCNTVPQQRSPSSFSSSVRTGI